MAVAVVGIDGKRGFWAHSKLNKYLKRSYFMFQNVYLMTIVKTLI